MNSPFGASPDRVMDNVIPIYGSDKPLHEKALVYCFDSGDYSSMNGVSGYDWITPDQFNGTGSRASSIPLRTTTSRCQLWPTFISRCRNIDWPSMTKIIRGTGFEKKRSAVPC